MNINDLALWLNDITRYIISDEKAKWEVEDEKAINYEMGFTVIKDTDEYCIGRLTYDHGTWRTWNGDGEPPYWDVEDVGVTKDLKDLISFLFMEYLKTRLSDLEERENEHASLHKGKNRTYSGI